MKSTFVGQKTNLKQNISLTDKKILAITCIHGDRLYSLGLKVQTRNGVKQKIDIGYPPQDESDKPETDTKELPKYQFIRSATFYGEIEDKDEDEDGEDQEIEKSEDLAKSQLHKSVINNGEPLLTKNGANFIYPENLKKSQYIKLTGIMFDIIA